MDDLTKERLAKWVAHFSSDPNVKEYTELLTSLHDDVFKNQELKHIDYQNDIPKEFTKEMYIKTFSKVWATIRHEIYKEMNGEAVS